MTGELANADLSPVKPKRSSSSPIEYASTGGWQADGEVYRGKDQLSATPNDRGPGPLGKPAEGISQTANGYQISFSDAELSQVAKAILGDTLGLTYVFDPRVQGRVTVATGAPVSRRELLSIFEDIVGMFRGAMIADGNIYRIVPGAEAGREAVVSVDYAREAQEVGPGYGVSIVPLRYVSSDTMLRLLESLAPGQNRLQSIVKDDLIIIRGTGRERETLLQTIYMFDVDWMKGQSAGIYTLENSSPDEVISQLQQVFHTDGRGKGLISFRGITRLNAVLVLTQKSKLLDEAGTWISRLDTNGPEAENYYVYRVEYGKASDLAQLLTAMFNGKGAGGRRPEEAEVSPGQSAGRAESSAPSAALDSASSLSMSPTSTMAASGGAGVSGGASAAGSGGGSSGYSQNEADSTVSGGSEIGADSDDSGKRKGKGDVQITPDDRDNRLLIKASGRDLRKILGVLRRIDRAPLQVLINATVAEVTLNNKLNYGVQFYLQKKAGSIGFSSGQSIDIAPTVPGLNFIWGSLAPSPKVILDALAAETSVRVVSSPSVVVLHNQPATLMVGDKVPYTTQSAVSVTTPGAPIVNSIQYQDTGVTLKVTPKINSNGLVTMTIDQEVSQVAAGANADTLTPTISQRAISSTIAVQSGQMVVLGGLISETANRSKTNIPLLNKVPYVGDILGADNTNAKTRQELVVFLQARVIRDTVDASEVAEEMRARLQSLAPRPAAWDAHVVEGLPPDANGARQVK